MVEKEDETKIDGEAALGGEVAGKTFNVCAKSPRVKTTRVATIQTANV